uniref:TEP1-F n=1 Tax=Stomoxys calcitrans TaxID=35570 RepID=A0A1I8NLA8_STOCA
MSFLKYSYAWLVFTNYLVLSYSESYYSIIAPGVIKSYRKYTVAVALHEANQPATIKISIEGLSAVEEVTVQPYETKNVHFNISKLERANYYLIAEGISGISFYNSSVLNCEPDAGPHIYIQTDRAIYKPGEVINFRVVIIDENTKPFKTSEPIEVEILDSNGNRINLFSNIVLANGIFEGKCHISKYPPLGEWSIKVTIKGHSSKALKTISIQMYELPKFAVYIEGEREVTIADGIVKAKVYGKYPFDRYVEGNLTVQLKSIRSPDALMEMKFNTTNIVEVEFKIDKLSERINTVFITAELQEKNTGVIHKGLHEVTLHRERYRISVDSDSIEFQNGRPYRLKAKVSHWNGSLVQDRTTPVRMHYHSEIYKAFLDDKGEALFQFEHHGFVYHEFYFNNSKLVFYPIDSFNNVFEGNKDSILRLKLQTNSMKVGVPFDIAVRSTADIPYLFYAIVSHGNIIKMEYVGVSPKQTSYVLRIKPTIEMIPRAMLYIFYIKDGIFHYQETILRFDKEFENKVSLDAPKICQPGESVELSMKAQPNARVCILAVDKRILHLNSNYDLSINNIWNNLASDRTYLPIPATQYPGMVSGVVTLTNANYYFLSVKSHTDKKECLGIEDDWVRNFNPRDSIPEKDFRRKFPKTWIFQCYEIEKENTLLTFDIPDTITTWHITAFSMHENTGFGTLRRPVNILSSKPFFILLDLPHSAKMGELISIPITVVNNHNQSVEASIVMTQGEEYFVAGPEQNNQTFQKTILVPANGVDMVEFILVAEKFGDITIRVVARNALSSDALVTKLYVEPEGIQQQGNEALYISSAKNDSKQASLVFPITGNIISNSEYIALSVGGDTLVPTLEHLQNLVRLPTGSGEQNMVNFAPSILILDYLTASQLDAKTKELMERTKRFLEIGYQQQLSYRHKSGGFSMFGEGKETEPSTWLTAYTIRFFIKAKKYFPIRNDLIDSGMEFLANKQLPRGDFPFTGQLSQPAGQSIYGFTSFVLLAFFEDQSYVVKYRNTIQKALDFLAANISKVKKIYDLSIVAHLLQKAEHPSFQEIWQKIQAQQQQKHYRKWWSGKVASWQKDVEITSYVLMTQLATNRTSLSDDQPILKWLISRRNEMGGFASTHDTVLGLQALVKFSEKYSNMHDVNMKILYTAKSSESQILDKNTLSVDPTMALVLQTQDLPRTSRILDVQANGSGQVLLQLSYRYYKLDEGLHLSSHFQIQSKVVMDNIDVMNLEVCFTNKPSEARDDDDETKTIIMEVNFPTGFIVNADNKNNLTKHKLIQRIESKSYETALIIYFRKPESEIRECFHFIAHRIHNVKLQKRAAIIVYDIYNLTRHDIVFYNLPSDIPDGRSLKNVNLELDQFLPVSSRPKKRATYVPSTLEQLLDEKLQDVISKFDLIPLESILKDIKDDSAKLNNETATISDRLKQIDSNVADLLRTNMKANIPENVILQLPDIYLLTSNKIPPYFYIHAVAFKLSDTKTVVDICFNYNQRRAERDRNEESMTIMQINLPPGLELIGEKLENEALQNNTKIEYHNSKKTLLAYFGTLESNNDYCMSITASLLFFDNNPSKVSIVVYDLYHMTRYGIGFCEIRQDGPTDSKDQDDIIVFPDDLRYINVEKRDLKEVPKPESSLNNFDEKIAVKLNTYYEHIIDKLSNVSREVSSIKDEIKKLKIFNQIEDAAETSETFGTLTFDYLKTQDEMDKLKKEDADLWLEIITNSNDISDTYHDISKLKEVNSLILKRVSGINDEINPLRKSYLALKGEISKLKENISTLLSEVNKMRNKNREGAKHSSDNSKAKQDIEVLKADIRQLIDGIALLRQDNLRLNGDITNLKNENSFLRHQLAQISEYLETQTPSYSSNGVYPADWSPNGYYGYVATPR